LYPSLTSVVPLSVTSHFDLIHSMPDPITINMNNSNSQLPHQ
jgi:hypothetical protein